MDDYSWMFRVSPERLPIWVIIMGLMVLLITHYIIRKILVDIVLDVYVRGL